jgi:rare lipoprotein A
MQTRTDGRIIAIGLAAIVTAGCSLAREGTRPFEDPSPEARTTGPSGAMGDAAPGAVPRPELKSRIGNPDSYVVFGERYRVLDTSAGFVEEGIASWYGEPFHGRRTSSGETYDMHQLTAAHKHLPLPTYALVTNLENGRRIVVRVNDRGPFHGSRIIDLSYAAAKELDMIGPGTARVEVRALDPPASDAAR